MSWINYFWAKNKSNYIIAWNHHFVHYLNNIVAFPWGIFIFYTPQPSFALILWVLENPKINTPNKNITKKSKLIKERNSRFHLLSLSMLVMTIMYSGSGFYFHCLCSNCAIGRSRSMVFLVVWVGGWGLHVYKRRMKDHWGFESYWIFPKGIWGNFKTWKIYFNLIIYYCKFGKQFWVGIYPFLGPGLSFFLLNKDQSYYYKYRVAHKKLIFFYLGSFLWKSD